MFRKPKKQNSRRVFSGNSDDENEVEKMSVDAIPEPIPTKKKVNKEIKSVAKESSKKSSSSKSTLLSFGDEEGTLDLLQTILPAKHAHFMAFSFIITIYCYLIFCLLTLFIC